MVYTLHDLFFIILIQIDKKRDCLSELVNMIHAAEKIKKNQI